MTSLPPELRRTLDNAAQGERILWSGQPRAGRMWSLFGIWLFAVPWTVFSIFWEAMALTPWLARDGAADQLKWTLGIAMPIFGIPFIAIGFGMLGAPFWTMSKAKLTIYALTEKRLLTITTGRSTKVVAASIDRTGPIETNIARDGSGSFKVQTGSHRDSDGDRVTDKVEFVAIDDVAALERQFMLLRRT